MAPLTSAAVARAEEAKASGAPSRSAEADVIAEALFRDALSLMDAGKYQDACPKLEESQRLAPGLGTRFHLANCYEKLGRVATAWATFVDLAEAARAANNTDGAKKASARADALLPLPALTISVSDGASGTPGIEVQRDGIALGRATWGTAIPVDPGDHTVSVSAPDRETWTTLVRVEGPHGTASVLVPPLAQAASGIGRRGIGLIIGGAGVAGAALGGVFGLVALSKAGDARAQCAGDPECKPSSFGAQNGAYTFADLSTGFFIVGGAAAAAGAVLFFTAPSPARPPAARIHFVPVVGANAAFGLVEGTF